MSRPTTVTVAVPVFNEAAHIDACLAAIERQTYPHIAEVLVVDGGSTDGTQQRLENRARVRLLDNPERIQSAALNLAIDEAIGDVIVRVDGHCVLADDYVERCVETLEDTGAAIVGGSMTPQAAGRWPAAIAAAMSSRIGAGPARFHRDGPPAWTDTVYLGAYRADLARQVGGYAPDMVINEDAEFAHRMSPQGGVRYEPSIRSVYTPRGDLASVARQFYRYGRSRATTVKRHPSSLSPRQLAAPALVVGLAVPATRRPVLAAYALAVVGWAATARGRRPALAAAVLPAMHLPWGVGFLIGLVRGPARRPGDA